MMTISEHIESKIKLAKLIAIVSWLVFAGMMLLPYSAGLYFYYFIPFAGFAGAVTFILFFIKCPSCNQPLGQVAAYSGNPFQKKSNLNFCPNCGVNFENEI